MYDTRGEISGWENRKKMVKRNVRNGREARRSSPPFQNLLPAQENPVLPAGKCPPGGGNAAPPDENDLQAENETAYGGGADGVSVDDRRAKTLLEKEKRKDDVEHEKRGQRRERGEEDSGANPQHVPAKNNGDKEIEEIIVASLPHPDDDEQLQDDEEQPRGSQNHAGGAWRYRARVDIVHRKIRAVTMKHEVKCALSRPDSFKRRPSSERGVTNRGINKTSRKRECMSREKVRQPKCHCSALSRQDQNFSGIADICELRMKQCSTRSMLQETRKARAESPDETRASKKAGATTAHPQASARPQRPTSASASQNDTPPTQGNARSAEPPAPKHARENLQNSASPQSKKQGDMQRSPLTHEITAHFPGRLFVVLRLGFGRRRDVCAMVLRCAAQSRVVVTGRGGVGGNGRETERRGKENRGKEQGGMGVSGGRGAEGFTTRARIAKKSAKRFVERDASTNTKTGSSVRVRDVMEELRRVDHGQAEKYGSVRERIRKKGRGRVDGESVYGKGSVRQVQVHCNDETLSYPSTSRYAENCACKRGTPESCVAHRKWRRVDVRMKERGVRAGDGLWRERGEGAIGRAEGGRGMGVH
ncbi:hypothetical protein C8J57DRAFT_1245065 [Mycena rebaudengoi]|nr:hypothetical protein C8J57DRAFT_1245065 [Mycena rebaudengoi]